ncbi:gluconokinase [Pinirhizobacter sp.]|uniref:gluconokinase n=1 Tax=Pinirhizobacter sp. TaxID=2950432 RepID=UPI002F3FAE17
MTTESSNSHTGTPIVVVMGVSGSGKTTIGQLLATRMERDFVDSDQLHTPQSVAKMREGIPLTDDDREPWLEAIEGVINRHRDTGRDLVLAASALKAVYRERLSGPGTVFLFLHGTPALLRERLATRKGHFFDPHLLDSQLATLEEPHGDDVYRAEIDQTAAHIVDGFLAWLTHRPS